MPVNAPNFGTGAVDWGSYVNPNQQTIDADRAQVQQYIQGLPGGGSGQSGTSPQNVGGASPTTPGASLMPSFGQSSPVDSYVSQAMGAVPSISGSTAPGTPSQSLTQPQAQSALATPTGFEALFNQSKQPPGSTVPYGSLPPNPYGAGQDTQWDAALSGQNAQGLGQPVPGTPKPPAATAPTGGTGFQNTGQHPAFNPHSGPQGSPQPTGDPWQRYLKGMQP